jgi:hypothetical protein
VPDQADSSQAEGVHDRQSVPRLLSGAVSAPGRLGPAASAQVEAEQLILASQFRDKLAPGVPILGQAVQQHDRITGTGLGDMEPGAAGRHEPVGHPGQLRNRPGAVLPHGN